MNEGGLLRELTSTSITGHQEKRNKLCSKITGQGLEDHVDAYIVSGAFLELQLFRKRYRRQYPKRHDIRVPLGP